MADVSAVFPALRPAEILMLSNDAIDAYVSVHKIRELLATATQMEATHAAKPQKTLTRFMRRTETLRNSTSLYAVPVGESLEALYTEKYGRPITIQSDAALSALGFEAGDS